MPFAWLNEKFVDENDAAVPIRDTGLLHAAGVFTTMRSYAGRVFRLDAHLRRLRDSCEALFIPLQYCDDALSAAIDELLRRNELADARLRLTVTRGAAHQDPLHGVHLTPTVFITAAPLEPYPAEFYTRGLTVIVLDEQKLNPYDLQAGHKTLNYLSRLAALREANRRGAGEALWFNVHNYLQSGSISNVFIVKGGAVITPPTKWELREGASVVLPGVTRAAVLEAAKSAGIETRLERIDVNQLLDADEIFLTNSIMQVMPVCRIERKAIGDEKPGAVTRRLADALTEMTSASG
ncbi:MAG: branched-chain amino acid aminotransferase [Phycisphaerales bacterium]|jgi:branched-chain amino acid aminotransferase|nr:branched-chain amino acid aminotransferase [Phycisphaerales bacterium]